MFYVGERLDPTRTDVVTLKHIFATFSERIVEELTRDIHWDLSEGINIVTYPWRFN